MSSPKILIVEDESIVALDMQTRLNRLGYEVVGISDSGLEAIEMAGNHQPDLALMDIRLRGTMDGVETANQFRTRYDIPVVYLTAYADEQTLKRAKVTEPLGYLVKPFEERELHSTIEMALYKIEMDKRLQAQTARLQRIVSTVPEGVALLDANHRLVLVNPRAEAYLADLAGVSVGDIVDRLGDTSIEHLLNRSGDESWHEIKIKGSYPRVFEAILSIAQPDSAPTGNNASEWVLVLREVTAERQIQERIQLQDRLAAVGQLAAGIAHDFNNILASLLLTPYMIQRTEPHLSPKNLERLDSITQLAKRASDLIKQILDFSRASAMEMIPIDLRPLLKELSKMLERMLPEDISFRLIYLPDDYMVKGDSTRIIQLLMNLVLNARDAMPNGGELCVELARVSGDEMHIADISSHNGWLRINVTDRGTGIHPDALPHVFEPFFTTKAPGKGTGLGLAQVYGIIQQHGGHINIDTQLGQGTTFSVYFPALSPLSPVEVHLGVDHTSPLRGNQQTILIVEDNPDVRQSICDILELSNYHILTASNGREALTVIDQLETQVDLILTDLVMPEMGGLELCRELRRKNSTVKVIILSGYISEETLEELKSLAVSDYLRKPIDAEHLVTTIESVWQKPFYS